MTSPATQYLYQLLSGAQLTQAVAAAAQLGIADALGGGAMPLATLAEATGCHAGSLERLLRALAVLGIVVERAGSWSLTDVGKLLRAGAPGSLRELALLAGDSWRAAAFDLSDSVRTGQPAFARRFGSPFYPWLEQHAVEGARFDAVQAAHTAAVDLSTIDLAEVRVVVDVGGGSGSLLGRLLAEQSSLEGVLFDMPSVAQRAAERFAASGLSGRARVVGGDFFVEVPSGGDLYLLVFVLHNWDDVRAARILERCALAMRPGARLAVVENLMQTSQTPASAVLLDLEMLVFHEGGRERTEAEYRALLAAAGFEVERVAPTGLLLARRQR